MMRSILVLSLLMLIIAGCAFTPHNVDVAIKQPTAVPSISAQEKTIFLEVIDERDEPTWGDEVQVLP